MTEKFDLAVIGAGAAGLTAAAYAAKAGKKVVIFDHLQVPAGKVFISGGGKCNFTNLDMNASHYVSETSGFAKSALARFKPEDIIRMLDEDSFSWGKRDDGKLFAQSGAAMRDFLLRRCQKSGADMRFGTLIDNVQQGFFVNDVQADNLLIATGGVSYPSVGATNLGLKIAKQFGLNVIDPRPALVPLEGTLPEFSDLAGVSVKVGVKVKGKTIIADMLFTHKGISGPAILQISLYRKKDEPIAIDFFPSQDLFSDLKSLRDAKEKRTLAKILSMKVSSRLAQKMADLLPEQKRNAPVAELSDKILHVFCDQMKRYVFAPNEANLWDKAEVMRGGVDAKELSSATMESVKVKGLYFAGEVIDVAGEVGGYNLHWAWASATAAAKAICAN